MNQPTQIIRPFAALRPAPQYADDVIAPPYDVLNTAEAKVLASGRPWSFLHVSKPEIDLAEAISPYDPAVYAKGEANLAAMVDGGILVRDSKPCYYLYQLVMGEHVQTGFVAAGSIKAYEAGRIRRHEFTRPDKEDDRVSQIKALNAQTGPVMVTHRANTTLSQISHKVSTETPDYRVTAHDGVEHTFWVIDDPETITSISHTFEAMQAIYIADGHHRSAAASRVAQQRGGGSENDDFLIVSFPHDQVRILDYNRVVKDLNGLSAEEFLNRIASDFRVSARDEPVRPAAPRSFGMYLDSQWYELELREKAPQNDPVAALDISLLSDRLLSPVLAIGDPRVDKRIDFIGGIRGLEELQRRVDKGQMAVAFSLYPTSLDDLMSVADAGEVMPPKSTWFEPKLADGMVSLVLD